MTQNRLPDDDDIRGGLETKPFLAHLEDLRWTIIRCAAALAVLDVIEEDGLLDRATAIGERLSSTG